MTPTQHTVLANLASGIELYPSHGLGAYWRTAVDDLFVPPGTVRVLLREAWIEKREFPIMLPIFGLCSDERYVLTPEGCGALAEAEGVGAAAEEPAR
jgi:hypothetical protein